MAAASAPNPTDTPRARESPGRRERGGPLPGRSRPPRPSGGRQRNGQLYDDHGRGDCREFLAPNRYGKSIRCVATLGSQGRQASSKAYVSPTEA